MAGAVVVAVAVGLVVLVGGVYWRGQPGRERRSLFEPLTAVRARPLAARFTVGAADRYRPFEVSVARSVPLSARALARLEVRGDRQAVAAAFALAGEGEEALRRLRALPPGPEVESDRGALMLAGEGGAAEALDHLDRALAARPQLPQALFNRGLALRALGLPLGAARSFRAVAALGEAGWAEEARRAAVAATTEMEALALRWQKVQAARAEDRRDSALLLALPNASSRVGTPEPGGTAAAAGRAAGPGASD